MFKNSISKNGGGRTLSPESAGDIRFSSDRSKPSTSKESSGGDKFSSRSKSRYTNTRSPRRQTSSPMRITTSRSKGRSNPLPLSGEMTFDEQTGSFREIKRPGSNEEFVSHEDLGSIQTVNLDLSDDLFFGDERSHSDGIGSAGILMMENFDDDSRGSISDMSPFASDIDSDRASSLIEADDLSDYSGSTEDFAAEAAIPNPPLDSPPKASTEHSYPETIRVESLVFRLLTERPSLWSQQDVNEFLSLVQYEEMKQFDLNGVSLLELPQKHTHKSLGISPHDYERFVGHIRHLARLEEKRSQDEALLAENKVLHDDIAKERSNLQQKVAEICDLRNAINRQRSRSKEAPTDIEVRAETTLEYIKLRLQDLLDIYVSKDFKSQEYPHQDDLMDVFSIEILFNQLQEKIQKSIHKKHHSLNSPHNASRRTSVYSEFEEHLVREQMNSRKNPSASTAPLANGLAELKQEFADRLNQAEEGFRVRLQALEENLERAQHKNALYEGRIRNSLDDSGLVDFREELTWLEKTLSHRKNETSDYVEKRISELKKSYETTLQEKQERIRILEKALFDTIPQSASVQDSPVSNPPFNNDTPYAPPHSVSQLEEKGVIALKSRIHEEIIGALRSENQRLAQENRENTRVLGETARRRAESLERRSVRSDQGSVVSTMDMERYRRLQQSRLEYKEQCKEYSIKCQYLKDEKRELKREIQILHQKLLAVENEGAKNVVALEELLDRKQLEVARGFSEMKKVRLQIQTLYNQMFNFFLALRKEHEKRMGVMRYNISLLQSCLQGPVSRHRAGSFHSTTSNPHFQRNPSYDRRSVTHVTVPPLRDLDDEYYLRARTQREFTDFIKAHFDGPAAQMHTPFPSNYSRDFRQPVARGSSVYDHGPSIRSTYGIRI